MKPQCVDILRYMEVHGSITDLEAGKNADGEPVRYARYYLLKE